jgi:hypothetical protein
MTDTRSMLFSSRLLQDFDRNPAMNKNRLTAEDNLNLAAKRIDSVSLSTSVSTTRQRSLLFWEDETTDAATQCMGRLRRGGCLNLTFS